MSNVCEGGVDLQQNLAQHMCPLIAPKGLQISIKGESLAVKPGEDITFIVRQEQVMKNFSFLKMSMLFLDLPFPGANLSPICLRAEKRLICASEGGANCSLMKYSMDRVTNNSVKET